MTSFYPEQIKNTLLPITIGGLTELKDQLQTEESLDQIPMNIKKVNGLMTFPKIWEKVQQPEEING